jgi:hypothetical protein
VAEVAADAQQPGRFTVFPQADAEILLAVSGLSTASGWQLDELRLESGRLDEVFRALTLTDEEVRH